MHCPNSMVKTSVQCARVNQIGHAQLFNMAQSLKIGMIDKVVDQVCGQCNKAVNGVVNDLTFFIIAGHLSSNLLKIPISVNKNRPLKWSDL